MIKCILIFLTLFFNIQAKTACSQNAINRNSLLRGNYINVVSKMKDQIHPNRLFYMIYSYEQASIFRDAIYNVLGGVSGYSQTSIINTSIII